MDFGRQYNIAQTALVFDRGARIERDDPLRWFRFKSVGQELLVLYVRDEIECYWRAGNQGGKTYGGAALGVALAQGRKELDGLPTPRIRTPNVGYVLTQTYKQQSESTQKAYLQLIGDWPHEIGWVDKKNDYISTIWVKPIGCKSDDFRDWSKIVFHCAQTGNSIPGGRIDWAHADEPPKMQMWREIRFRTRANAPLYRWITATMFGREDWEELERDFEGCFQNPKNGRVQIVTSVFDNEALSPEHLHKLVQNAIGDPYEAARLHGELLDLSGKCPFNVAKLSRWMKERTFDPTMVEEELLTERDTPEGRFVSEVKAKWEMYYDRDPLEEYLMVVDPSQGINDPYHDPAGIHIYSRRRQRLVARFNGYLSAYAIGYLACNMGARYGFPLCDIDMTGGYGDTVLRVMSDRQYRNFVLELIEERANDTPDTFRIGFKSTHQKRNALVGDIVRAIDEDLVYIPSKAVLSCLMNMTVDETGRVAAVRGRHDEDGLNFGLAVVDMRNLRPAPLPAPRRTDFARAVNAEFGRDVKLVEDRYIKRPRQRSWRAPSPRRK